MQTEKTKRCTYATCLIWLCWLIYACSYMGKVNYSANINQVMDYYRVTKGEAGLVGTFFFFAYGAGQIVNGLLCKKYNLKWTIFTSLAVSGSINFILPFISNFSLIKFLWLANGISMSFLWPSLIRLLSENLSKKDMARASVIIGTTVATGTFAIYGLSAIYAKFNFKFAFYTAGVVLPAVAIVWLILLPKFIREAKAEAELQNEIDERAISLPNEQAQKSEGAERKLLFLTIFTLMFYAVATNLIKDGLTTWVPNILKEGFNLDDSLSIILTLALPMVTVFGNMFAVALHKKVPSFVGQCTLQFTLAGILILAVIGSLYLEILPITIVGFAFACFFVGACNSIITSIFPLFMKGKVNSGLIAGILNGFCYAGSTLSNYGLGAVRDAFGSWYPVLWLLLIVCGIACLVCGVYATIHWVIKKKSV